MADANKKPEKKNGLNDRDDVEERKVKKKAIRAQMHTKRNHLRNAVRSSRMTLSTSFRPHC